MYADRGCVAFFGWRNKTRSVQLLSALPFGVGLFIVGPLLLIAVVMIVWWLMADWRAIPQATAPAPQEQKVPNQGAAGKGAVALLFHAHGLVEPCLSTTVSRT